MHSRTPAHFRFSASAALRPSVGAERRRSMGAERGCLEWQSTRNLAQTECSVRKTVRLFCGKLREAFSHLPVLLARFGEAHSQRISFGLICLLFSVKS
jgi:hypothetical protein